MMSSDNSAHRELQMIEHNAQQLLAQRQSLQFELNEVINALNELGHTKDDVYRVMGNIMMRADKAKLVSELETRKKTIELHIQALEKQEKLLEKKTLELHQKSVDKK